MAVKLRDGVSAEQLAEQALFALENVLAQFGTGQPVSTERFNALQATRAGLAGLEKLTFFGTCDIHGLELDRHRDCPQCRRLAVEAVVGPIPDGIWEQEESERLEIDHGLSA